MLERSRPRLLSSRRWTPPATTTSGALCASSTWTTRVPGSPASAAPKMPTEQNPILNNPYEEPDWHYATNLAGELDYSRPVKRNPGRRPICVNLFR